MTGSEEQPYLFISYAHKDLDPVKRIKLELNKRGIDTWFDEDDIIGGRKWEEEIYRGVDHCTGLLVILSQYAVASTWVQKEWQRAKAHGKTIIPILIAPLPQNPLPEIQWVDFKQYADEEKFLYATYDLIRAVCETTNYPNCLAILENIQKRLGSSRIEEHLEEIRRNTNSAEAWLNEIGQACEGQPGMWRAADPDENKQATTRLVSLALGMDIQDPQITLHAAQTIGQCGNRTAVVELATQLQAGTNVPQALQALNAIWQTRQEGIPNALLGRIWWRVKSYIAWRQFREPPVLSMVVAPIVAASLGLMLTLYMEYPDPSGTFPLTRISEAFTNGITYALFIGAGIALTAFFIPRLRILRQARYLAAGISGWLITALTFIVFNTLFYTRVPSDWSTVIQLSLWFIGGFAVSSLIPSSSLPRTFLRIGIAFAGVLAALVIPCSWSILPERLFYFGQDCQPKSLLVSVIIVLTAFLPELLEGMNQRGSLFQRTRLRTNRLIHNILRGN